MRFWRPTACAVIAALAPACRSEPAAIPADRKAAASTPSDRPMTGTGSDSLHLELVLPPSVHPGERVPIELRVRNQTARTLDLYLRGRTPTFDVVVTRPDGELVWRRLEDEIIPAILQLRPLASGEQLEVDATWDQRGNSGRPVEPGDYAARGLLLVEGNPLPTPLVPFRVLAR